MEMDRVNEITEAILRGAFKVNTALGPGLLESAYHECLYYELEKGGLLEEKEHPIPLIYQEVKMNCGFRDDPSTWAILLSVFGTIFFCYFPLKNPSITRLFKHFLKKTIKKILVPKLTQ